MYKSSSNKKKEKHTLKKVFSIFRDFYFDFYMCFFPNNNNRVINVKSSEKKERI